MMRQLLFHFVHLMVSTLPFLFLTEAFDSLNHNAAIPGTVKYCHMTILWKLFPETPQIMMCFFCIIGCCHRIYLIPPWIQCLGQPFDGSAFSTGIPAFKCQHHRNPVFIKFIMKLGKSCLKTCKFFFVLFFFHLL